MTSSLGQRVRSVLLWLRGHGPSRRATMLGVSGVAILAAVVVFHAAHVPQRIKTYWFIQELDLARYVRQGSDFCNPDYSLEGAARRLGVPPDRVDRIYGYDFRKLAAVEKRLEGIDRPTVLRAVFETLTAGVPGNAQRHVRVLKFLQQASLHNVFLQPTYPDRTMVTDPLVLLELGEMRCGHVARLAVDLFEAAGYRGRLVQLGGHIIAEVEYDGGWHYVDADLFGNGDTVLNADGTIPSVEELSREPRRIDALPTAWEPGNANAVVSNPGRRPSYYYFSRRTWERNFAGRAGSPKPPYVLYKQSTPSHQRRSRAYGWDRLIEETAPRVLADIPPSHPPGAPQWESVRVRPMPDGRVHVAMAWRPSTDPDGDLMGYRVMVSRRSRGWNYGGKSLPDCLMPLKSSTAEWDPGMYEARFTLPGSEIALLETSTTAAELTLDGDGDYCVTVMPYDAYGEQVGQRLYPVSEEIRIRAGRPGGTP